jgi:flavin reductase (DIM6/NTAB) family NADH-FMN oxidoreductase RutF
LFQTSHYHVPARRGWNGTEKDTLINIWDTEEFVINIVSDSFAEKLVLCANDFEPDVDEFDISDLAVVPSPMVTPPRVGDSKINFECRLKQIVEIGNGTAGSGFAVIGTIALFHIDDGIYDEGRVNLEKLKPVGRLAENWYTRLTDNYKIIRKIKLDL